MAKASKLKEFNRGISSYTDGTYFCSNFINSDTSGLSNRLALEEEAKYVVDTTTANLTPLKNSVTVYTRKSTLDLTQYQTIIATTSNYDLCFILHDKVICLNGMVACRDILLDVNNNISVASTSNNYTFLFTTLYEGITSSSDTLKIPIDIYNKLTDGNKELVILDDYPEAITWTTESADATTATLTISRGVENTTASSHVAGATILIFKGYKSAATTGTAGERLSSADQTNFLVDSSGILYSWISEDYSDFASKVDLKGYTDIKGMGIFATATGSKILVAANNDGLGALFVWDGVKTSIDRAFYFDENILAIDKQYFALESGIYSTDTYSYTKVVELPDMDILSGQSTKIEFMKLLGENILFSNNPYTSVANSLPVYSAINKTNYIGRRQGGLWLYNIEDGSLYKIQIPSGGYYNLSYGSPILSNDGGIYFTSSYNYCTLYKLNVQSQNVYGNRILFNYLPQSGNIAKNLVLKLNVSIDEMIEYKTSTDLSGRIIVRYFDFKKPFIKTSEVYQASGTEELDLIYLKKGTGYPVPMVGDRIELIERASSTLNNCSGISRNITSVDAHTSYYRCYVDRDLPEYVNVSYISKKVELTPLKLVDIITLNETTLDNNDFYVSIEDMPETKKIMIEIEVENDSSNAAIVLNSVEIESNFSPK